MADKTSIHKVRLDMAHIDQHRYEQLCFTMARGSKESYQHLIMRMLAYAMIPEQRLAFGSGVDGADVGYGPSPDVMVKGYDDHYIYWIDVGFPKFERIKKASHQADHVMVLSINHSDWLAENQVRLLQLGNVQLVLLDEPMLNQLSGQLQRSINWSLVVDGAKLGVSTGMEYCESALNRFNHTNQAEQLLMAS